MPEGEPRPQGLPNVDHQDRDRAAVADEPDDYSGVEDRLQLGALQDVDEESGEERTRAQRDDAEIEEDPQAEGEAVIHIRLVQPAVQAETGGINSDREQRCPGSKPEQETGKGGSLGSARNPSGIGQDGASHLAPPNAAWNWARPMLVSMALSTGSTAWVPCPVLPAGEMLRGCATPLRPDRWDQPGCRSESHL